MTIKNRYGTECKIVGHEEADGMGGERSTAARVRSSTNNGSRSGKAAGRARYVSAILLSMMFVLGAFAVIPAQAAGPAIVNLGTAGDFAVLAKTGVSTTGTTHVTGDIGISPSAATYITGFGLIMDSTGTFSTSSVVTGKIYASDYTSPTPTKMTTAVSDMQTAYTDAAGRTTPDYTELYAGDVTGKTLTPGLYKWGTGLLISAGGVTISGTASDVWIFQIAQDLTVADNAIVTLSGGAKATNIFWQVAGQVTLGTTVAMKGIILCQTLIEINTGATLVGRALAQTAVTLDANVITVPTDTVSPTVTSTIPFNAATGVAINSAMTATFNEAMDPLTINATTFTLKQGTTPVSGTVTYSLLTAKFAPLANLASSTLYTATITTGATDIAGNALASNYVWTFTTGAVADTIPPTVSSTVPVNEATGVAINSAMTATFSEAMDSLTINSTTFTLKQGTTPVPGAVTYIDFTGTFRPTLALASSTVYTATITTGAKDLAGNAMASNYIWTFTTGAVADTTAPTVTSTVPANGATGVAINSAMTATFSEAMDPYSFNPPTRAAPDPIQIPQSAFNLMQGTTPVLGTVSYFGFTATFRPSDSLEYSTVYTATITTDAKDLAGNAMAADYVWSFTTGDAPDTTAPMVTSTIPANSAVNVPVNTMVDATFSEGMDPLTITTITFTLKQGATAVAGTVTYSQVSAVFDPTSILAASTVYTATITTGAKDLAGNAMAADYVWSFTTGTVADTTAPTVTSTIPANGAVDVPINTMVGATFSEGMDPLTITTITFTLKQGTTAVPGTVTYSQVSAVFDPTNTLAASTVYTATITTGAKDLAGNPMASNYVWSFTTGTVADTTAPTVTSTIHANGAVNVPINTMVGATFSEGMDPLTITTITFTLKQGATAVAGTVSYSLVSAVFDPTSILAANTVYTATITTGAKDLAGNAMAADYVWSFTTGDTPDTTAPMVTSTIHANGAVDVPINTMVGATFSEAMDPLTITTMTFILKQGTTPVSGTVTYSLVSAVFDPTSTLAASTVYTATITTGATDLAGNAMAADYVWSFTTGADADTTAPTVIATINEDGATDVPVNMKIGATFSEGMDPLTITTISFTLKHGATAVSGTVTYSGVTAVFVPSSILAANTEYTATITTGVKDLAGNAMAADYVWSWTTGSALDTTPPTVISTVPANAATGVAINSAITATFSEAMDPLTITTMTLTFILKQGTTSISGTVTYSQVSAIFTPSSNLAVNTEYTATITTGVTDLAGNNLATKYVWDFDTNPAVIPPANGTIIGTIVDENGEPVQNATVSLGDTGLTATTNSDGEYTFTDVPPGTYTLGFNASGYEPSTTSATVTAGETTTVPDTVLAPSDDGSSNLWWIMIVIAAIAVAAIVGWSLMNKKKPNADANKGRVPEENPEKAFPGEPYGEAPEKPPLE